MSDKALTLPAREIVREVEVARRIIDRAPRIARIYLSIAVAFQRPVLIPIEGGIKERIYYLEWKDSGGMLSAADK